LIFPFVLTASRDLLEALPRNQTAHAALRIDIRDVLRGESLAARDRPSLPTERELTPTELRVLRFLPTNMSRTEIARALYFSVNTVNTHVRNIYARLACAFDRRRTIAGIELRLVSASASR
jgi:LuxR family transcriptional regulator, maltose regulon positive regulatory protein